MADSSDSSWEQLVALPNAKSKVWAYFGFPANSSSTIIDKKKVYCKLCDPPFPISYSTNTSNLTYHLQRNHPEEHRKISCNKSKNTSTSTPVGLQQPTISPLVSKPYPRNSRRAEQLVHSTANFIALSLQPVSVVDEPSFRMLLAKADLRFELPHRTHFATKVIPERYVSVHSRIEEQLGEVDYCTITTDLWTASHQHRSYISLTIHFVDANFSLNSLCLKTLEVAQDHTAEFLRRVLLSMFEEWNITDKVFGGTTDNGQNIVNAIGLLGLQHFPCLAHTLQLAIRKAFTVSRVHSAVARCKKLVEHFNKSTKETYKLREKQKMLQLSDHKLIQDCPTRWGSTLAMLKRVSEQQAAIAAVLIEGKLQHLMPEGEEWRIIENLVSILHPFQEATEVMSTDKYPTISSVKPVLYKLIEKTLKEKEDDVMTTKMMKKEIKADLVLRYQASHVMDNLNTATFLDPRYKELPFMTATEKEDVFDNVESELISLHMVTPEHSVQLVEQPSHVPDSIELDQNECGSSSRPAKRAKKSDNTETRFSKLLGEIFNNDNNSLPPRLAISEKVKREVSLYRAELPADLDSDPLKWWKDRQLAYPLLTKLIQKRYSMVATSVPSERLFSTAGNIIHEKRSSLLPENADKLIFLHENAKL